MRRLCSVISVLALSAGLAVGCEDENEQAIGPDPTATSNETASAAAGAAARSKNDEPVPGDQKAGPSVVDETFELTASADGPFTKGQLANFAITLKGRGGWHVNQDFPTTVELTARSDLAFPKKELEKSDAAEFGEERARFDVPFTPAAPGAHEVTAKVSFAMCTDQNCIPEQRTVAVVLPVEGG